MQQGQDDCELYVDDLAVTKPGEGHYVCDRMEIEHVPQKDVSHACALITSKLGCTYCIRFGPIA